MTIDINKESLIPFREARSKFPGNRRIALCTLHRWRKPGIRGICLETALIGGIRYTSLEAISRFIAAQNAVPEAETPLTATQRTTMAESAQIELQRAGI